MQHNGPLLHLLCRFGEDRPVILGEVNEERAVQLIDRCIDGDRVAQKEMYGLLAPRFYPLCVRYVGDRTVAEDILQDGFVTLFQKLRSYSGSGSFDGWARRIFINTALMYLRKGDALKMSEDISEAFRLQAGGETAIDRMGYRELIGLIAKMPAGFRTVFNMYVMEGFSHKEIAEALGITETTSRTQLSRGRIWLQNRIGEMYG